MANNQLSCPESPTGGHYWKCGAQNGPVGEARCKYCGAKQVLQNSLTDDQETNAMLRSARLVWGLRTKD